MNDGPNPGALPHELCDIEAGQGDHGGPEACPWGNRTAGGPNPYTEAPDTGFTRTYGFNVSRDTIAPAGFRKSVLLVNEQFLQHGTPWMDGTPGVSQCAPSRPARASRLGRALRGHGRFVHGSNNVDYDVDVGPLMMNHWWHENCFTVVEEVMAPGFPGPDALGQQPDLRADELPLREGAVAGGNNGTATTNNNNTTTTCTDNAGLSKFRFQSSNRHRLRFVNSGSKDVQRVSLDGHAVTVMAQDFVEAEPYEARVDPVVRVQDSTTKPRAFWLRANMTSCWLARQPPPSPPSTTATPYPIALPGSPLPGHLRKR
ncbi:hypothetical protein DL769_001574 [Monosporascus sp. CRB-8-3]|nr:hypothetical protein DL769_001574 [Monosporascus sp. CRB-8-3]